MRRRLVIAHLSDLHLSAFGERVTPSAFFGGLLPKPAPISRFDWREFELLEGWRIQRWTASSSKELAMTARGSLGLRLVDPRGLLHGKRIVPPGLNHSRRVEDALAVLRDRARVRSRAAHGNLCKDPPCAEERAELLALDPKNTNLRFLEAMDTVRRDSPDVVVLSGDITDDGEGYELVICALSEYIVAGKLVAVAGNHDLSAVPPGTSINMALSMKANRWDAFRNVAKLPLERTGASSRVIEGVLFLGLNSSIKPSRFPFSGRGRVGKPQLQVAARLIDEGRDAEVKVGVVHHHVAHLRLGPISRADPGQFAMKLADARRVVELFERSGFAAVLNGHRHHGYHVREGGLPHVVSSPSTTLGCNAAKSRYYWLLNVFEDNHVQVERRDIDHAS